MKIDKRKLMAILPFLVLGTSAVAIWIGGMNLSGTITATEGTQPDVVSFTENLVLTGANYTFGKNYTNTNGDVTMTFSQDVSGVSSTSANCNFAEDEDLLLEVYGFNGIEGYHPASENPTVDLVAGVNQILFRVSTSPYRCALTGTYEVLGTIA